MKHVGIGLPLQLPLPLIIMVALMECSANSDINHHHQPFAECPATLTFEEFQQIKENRSFLILYTVDSRRVSMNCASCKLAENEFRTLCQSYRLQQRGGDWLFVRVLFNPNDERISSLFKSLEVSKIPQVELWQHGQRKLVPSRYIIRVDLLARWLSQNSGLSVEIVRPPPLKFLFFSLAMVSLLTVLVVGIFLRQRGTPDLSFVGEVFNSKNFAYGCTCVVLASISGQMWNQIRGAPLFYYDSNTGSMGFISKGTSNQFIIESYIVLAVYIVISKSLVHLDGLVRDGANHSRCITQTEATKSLTGLVVFTLASSSLMTLYRLKAS